MPNTSDCSKFEVSFCSELCRASVRYLKTGAITYKLLQTIKRELSLDIYFPHSQATNMFYNSAINFDWLAEIANIRSSRLFLKVILSLLHDP